MPTPRADRGASGTDSVGGSPVGESCRALRVRLTWSLEPERAALLVRGSRDPFAFIGRWAGGGALIGSEPVAVAAVTEDPFEIVERLPAVEGADSVGRNGAGFVGGGWFGFLGYELGATVERLDTPPPGDPALPPFRLAFYDHLVRMDADGVWWFEALVTDEREAPIEARLEEFSRAVTARPTEVEPFRTGTWGAVPTPAGHGLAVAACRDRIRAGDLFQANICLRLGTRLEGDPLDLFVSGAGALQPDRAAYLSAEDWAIASLSPELFLERRGTEVRTAPIKGTRPRPEGAAEAERFRVELAGSEKDLAENRMILDMARNDLGRVCEYGSVEVVSEAETRPHAGVWHLVSEVTGRLHPARRDRDLLRAAFPPASVTGAPKVAAQNVIAELESSPRGAYTGAVGFVSPAAGLELSVAIRTFEVARGRIGLGLGGGIVADSDAAEETVECATKAAPLLAAIGGPAVRPESRHDPTGSPRPFSVSSQAVAPGPRPFRLGPVPVPRPDPGAGVFETVRVADGRAEQLDRHLARLGRSLDELYGLPRPDGLRAEIESAVDGLDGLWRVRVDLVVSTSNGRARSTPEFTVTTARAANRSQAGGPVELRPVTVPGGLGAHKWRDRRLLVALGEHVAPATPLLCDLDGNLLEADRANVFAIGSDGVAATPPLDGRILPGVTRRRVIERPELIGQVLAESGRAPVKVGRVEERPVHLGEIETAAAVLVTSSISLVEFATVGAARCLPGAGRSYGT